MVGRIPEEGGLLLVAARRVGERPHRLLLHLRPEGVGGVADAVGRHDDDDRLAGLVGPARDVQRVL